MSENEAQLELAAMRAEAQQHAAGYGAALRLILTFGAALEDARPDQATRIRKRSGPLLERMRKTGETAPLYRLIREVLGAQWRPAGQAAELIAGIEASKRWAEGVAE